jgi:hypothetical protein
LPVSANRLAIDWLHGWHRQRRDLTLGGSLSPFGFTLYQFNAKPIPFGPHNTPVATKDFSF